MSGAKIQRRFEHLLSLSRLLVLVPVIFLLLDAAASFIYGADILLRTTTGLIGEPARVGGRLGRFIVVMDSFLVGATLLVAAFGLYELFVIKGEHESDRHWLPGWLDMRDLEDLKARIVSMLILVAAITFVDVTVESHDEQNVLYLGAGIALIIAALTAFLRFGRQRHPPSADGEAPAATPAPAEPTRPARRGPAETGRDRARVMALLGGSRRDGDWSVAPVTDVIAAAGMARLDLRDAVLPGERLRIRVVAACGAVLITVPPEMHVADSGLTLLGSRSVSGGTAGSAEPGAPTVVISGICVLGGVRVRRGPRKR